MPEAARDVERAKARGMIPCPWGYRRPPSWRPWQYFILAIWKPFCRQPDRRQRDVAMHRHVDEKQ